MRTAAVYTHEFPTFDSLFGGFSPNAEVTFARSQGYEVPDALVFSDKRGEGGLSQISATTLGLSDLFSLIGEAHFDALIVPRIDVLVRCYDDGVFLKSLIKKTGVRFLTSDKVWDSNSEQFVNQLYNLLTSMYNGPDTDIWEQISRTIDYRYRTRIVGHPLEGLVVCTQCSDPCFVHKVQDEHLIYCRKCEGLKTRASGKDSHLMPKSVGEAACAVFSSLMESHDFINFGPARPTVQLLADRARAIADLTQEHGVLIKSFIASLDDDSVNSDVNDEDFSRKIHESWANIKQEEKAFCEFVSKLNNEDFNLLGLVILGFPKELFALGLRVVIFQAMFKAALQKVFVKITIERPSKTQPAKYCFDFSSNFRAYLVNYGLILPLQASYPLASYVAGSPQL